MKVIVQAEGHQELAALSDVMRAFFGSLTSWEDHQLLANWQKQLEVESRVEPAISAQTAREASRSGQPDGMITVSTRLQGSD